MSLLTQLYEVRWLLLTAALVLYVVYKYRIYKRLQHFDGPFGAGFSEFWHIKTILRQDTHLVYKAVNEKYGPIARVGPNELLTSSFELLAHMSAVRSPYTRSYWFNASTRFEVGRDHIFSQLDEAKHTKRRQQITAGYSGKENLCLEPDIDGRVQELLHLIRSKYISTAESSKPMDLARKVQFFALDVISKIGFGEEYGDLQADADLDDYIKSVEQGISISGKTAALGLTRYLQWPPIARLLGPSERDNRGFGKMMSIARKLIDSRLEKPTEGRSDMLASFMHHGLSRDELFSEAVLQIFAGSDTIAIAIRAAMLYLITHNRVYRRLQAEVDAAVRSGTAPAAPDIITDSSLKTLPYLQAIIRESIRIFPPVTDQRPKKVPPGGDTVTVEGQTYFLPGGTNVSYNQWGLQRSKAVFGDDADVWRPERWLLDEKVADNEAKLAEMRRTTEMVFGWGKYQCLGKGIAWLEIGKVVFELMRHFDWALVDPDKPWRSNSHNGLWVQDQMGVLVYARQESVY